MDTYTDEQIIDRKIDKWTDGQTDRRTDFSFRHGDVF